MKSAVKPDLEKNIKKKLKLFLFVCGPWEFLGRQCGKNQKVK